MLREIFCQAYPEILTFRIPKAQAMMGLQRDRPLVSLSNQFIGLRSTPARLALPC